MIKVYIASKMSRADEWRELYSAHPDVHMTSRWPFLEPFVKPAPDNARKFWVDDVADITACDAVIVYAEEGEHLRGGLVEAGIGIALGKEVIVIGEHEDYGTWQYHPNVKRFGTLELAFMHLGVFL